MTTTTRADDERLLHMLDFYHGDRESTSSIAKRYGLTKNAVIGQMSRIRKDEVQCNCVRRNNQNGGMKRGWWM